MVVYKIIGGDGDDPGMSSHPHYYDGKLRMDIQNLDHGNDGYLRSMVHDYDIRVYYMNHDHDRNVYREFVSLVCTHIRLVYASVHEVRDGICETFSCKEWF